MQDAFRFGDTRIVKAVFFVPAIEIAQLHLGDEVDVHLPQSAGIPVKGKITLISSVADQQSRLFRVQVSLPNPNKSLLVGTTGSLDLKTGLNLQKRSVPFTALVGANADTHGYTVFVLQRQGDRSVVKLRKVYLVSVAGDRAIIDGDLQPNEQVVDRPSEQLRDGSTVVARVGEAQ
jgi:RND family efflux transporter MFP subunit